ncbi:heparin lyase I family protein [Maribacter sp.]|uniref:heparin lyase I family protein n=1 Tax=Maribacter sp. TaxID=1897614 RepID=UPI003C7675FE
MNINPQSPLKVLLFSIIFIFHLSCSKDTDLLTDYVLRDSQEIVNGEYVVDDIYMVSQNDFIVLDVLSNDAYKEQDNVTITATSTPTNGSVVINTDNTLTYTPDPVTETVSLPETIDTFTYTTEIVTEDQSITTEEGTVTVVITSEENSTPPEENSTPPEENNNSNCVTNGGLAGDTGLKTWCWENVTIPQYSGSKGVSFSNGELVIDSECYEQQITKAGNQLKFRVNPTTPEVGSWCSRDYNMRAEIRTAPWDIRHPKGTEEWFGWSYTFGSDYVVDQNNQWLFWQVHHGVVGDSPQTELMIIKDGQFNGHNAGELYVVNNVTSGEKYNPTGITPTAGQKLDIVVHVVWDDASNGLLQVWINGQSVYDQQVATVYSSSPWGGNAKWGIYKWPWASSSGVQQSQQQGITHLETFMGNLRIITRQPGNSDYLNDSFSLVAPN